MLVEVKNKNKKRKKEPSYPIAWTQTHFLYNSLIEPWKTKGRNIPLFPMKDPGKKHTAGVDRLALEKVKEQNWNDIKADKRSFMYQLRIKDPNHVCTRMCVLEDI